MELCNGKKPYISRNIAGAAAKYWAKENRTLVMRVYACKKCGWWHLTSKPDRYAKGDENEDL